MPPTTSASPQTLSPAAQQANAANDARLEATAAHVAAQCRLAQEAIANAQQSVEAYSKQCSPEQRTVLEEAKYGLEVAQGYRDDAARAVGKTAEVGRAQAAEAQASKPAERELPRSPSNAALYAREGQAKKQFDQASAQEQPEPGGTEPNGSKQVANSAPTPAPRPSWAAGVDRAAHHQQMSQDDAQAKAAREELAASLQEEFSHGHGSDLTPTQQQGVEAGAEQ